ncbi:hypothetical protein EAH69_11835 [Faecalibacter macacae]|uniref:RHS repeat protein n=2 Tax=Faecalibacter macacae TaxID=1859289 RepID=A0A3L9M3P6_9FLAO|nr:hypothetical protein EAH69_11835 [Faecalibacter macacae]
MMNILFAQEPNINFPTTPEFKKFSKNIDYPINLNTGGISYSIPLFNVQLKNNDISFNLNYSSYGVKVGDISNEFGHDWSLNIPKISREVRGIPDEFSFGYLNPQTGYSTANMADKAFRVNPNNPTIHPDNDISIQVDIYNRAGIGEYDLQADKFYFNINGKSGYFMFKDENYEIITYPFQDLKIYPDLPNSIKIVDSNGTEYHFGDLEESREINSSNYTTSWYVTKIINNNNIVTFDYDNLKTVYQSFVDEYKTIETHTFQGNEPYNPYPSNKLYSTNIIYKPYITNIHYENLHVNFSYINNDNHTGLKKIENITVLQNSKEVYKYLFNMSNYTSYDHTNNTTIRTFLDKISIKYDNNKIEDYYSFDYFNPSGLPGRLSLKLDLWGFYNNANNSTIIPSYVFQNKIYNNSDRKVNSDNLKFGILKSITLPTKGKILIDTEPNDVKRELLENLNIGLTNVGGLMLHLEDEEDYNYESIAKIITEPVLGPEMNENSNFPTSYHENFALNERSLVNIRLIKQFIGDDNCISLNSTCPKVYILGNNFSINLYEIDDNSLTWLESGNYTLVVENLSPNQFQRKNIVVSIENKIKNEAKKNKYANGLRVKSISHYDNNGDRILEKLYNYNDKNGISTGEYTDLGLFSSVHFTENAGYYVRLNSYSKNAINFNGIIYTRVSEIIKDVKNNLEHKIINTYFPPLEFSLVPKRNTPVQIIFNLRGLPLIPTIYPYVPQWRQNLLKSQLFYKNNTLIKEISNNYIFTYDELNGKYDYNFNIDQSMGWSVPLISQSSSEQVYLSKSTVTEYFEDSTPPVITEINYNYDSQHHLQLTKQTTTNSKGETITTEYKYPVDLASNTNSIWDKMVERNMIATPVETKVSNNTTVLSEQRTKFNYYPGTNNTQLILPQYVYTKKGAMGTDVNNDDRKITYNSYDTQGNLTQYTVENGIPVSIIWGYNGQYPIAKIEGASFDLVSSFENDLKTASNSNSLTKTSFDALRNAFPNALVTGYIYNPLVGVTMIIQPNGIAEHYKYDTANRLQEIKNDQGEVLKKFEYNYAQPQ